MLHARPDPGHHQSGEQRPESVRLGQQQPADCRTHGAECEQAALTEPFGDEPGGDLPHGHRGIEHALEDAGLGQRKPERLCPQRQEREQRFGQTVVGRMHGRARRESRARRIAAGGSHGEVRVCGVAVRHGNRSLATSVTFGDTNGLPPPPLAREQRCGSRSCHSRESLPWWRNPPQSRKERRGFACRYVDHRRHSRDILN